MRVIAKAYRDRPLARIVVQTGDNIVYLADPRASRVAIDDEKTGVGFPRSNVFKFDADLYDRLVQAWACGNTKELQSLWSKAQPEPVYA